MANKLARDRPIGLKSELIAVVRLIDWEGPFPC